MKHLFLLPLITLFVLPTLGQINNQIKEKAKENSSSSGSGSNHNNTDSRNSSTNYNNNGSSNSFSNVDGFSSLDACLSCCGMAGGLISGVHHLQQKVLAKEDSVPSITSFEVFLDAGAITSEYLIIRPRIRGNRGIFSTDFRAYLTFERVFESFDTYHTIDWQILMLNIINTNVVKTRIGTGIMIEEATSAVYNEHTLGLDISPKGSRFKIRSELRLCPDYKNGTMVRTEVNGGFDYLIYDYKKLKTYLSISGLYAKYYESIDVSSLGFGINIRID